MLHEHAAALADGVAGALEVVGQRAPDELIGQAFLARTTLAPPVEGHWGEVAPTKRASMPAPRMAAAAKRPPLPPMLPNTNVRSRLLRSDRGDRPLAALEVAGVDGAGRRCRAVGGPSAGGPLRLAITPHGVQERLHAGHVAGAAAVAVAFEHGVRVGGEEVVEEVLDQRVRPAAVRAQEQREDVAGRRRGQRGAQGLAGAGPVHAAQARRGLVDGETVERQRHGAARGHQVVDARIDHRGRGPTSTSPTMSTTGTPARARSRARESPISRRPRLVALPQRRRRAT